MRIKLPCNGDRRIIKKFAWLPIIIDHELRWLENVEYEEYYNDYYFKSWRKEKFL